MPMSTARPSEFRLTPARAGLNAVAVPQGCNLQAGTAIFKCQFYQGCFMLRRILYFLVSCLLTMNLACSPNQSSDANANVVSPSNTNAPTNMPPGLSTSPVPLTTNSTPGIPDPKKIETSNTTKRGAPTPGIPDPKTIGKTPLPKGTTPTPGIPDAETLKKQLNDLIKDANVVNQPPKTDSNSIKNLQDKTRPVRKP